MESISQYVASIVTNPWFALVGFVIGLAGLATAFFFYIKGKKVKLPCYFLSSNNIINNLVSKFDSLEMLYSGQPVENLTVTKLFFWNNGRETIDVQDIPKSDPLKVYVKQGYKILDAKVIFSKNEANQFSVTTSSDKSHINLNFEYL